MKPLIGEPKELSKKLKTKDHADHAGPSQLLVNQNPPSPLPEEDYKTQLNNNQLTALQFHHTNATDALDVGQKMLMTTSKLKESLLPQNIHTLLDKALAKSPKVNTKSKASIWYKPVTLNN